MVMSIIKVASLLWLRSAAAGKLEPWWSWTWDRVPRWASGQGATDFSLNTTRYYTTNFDIMWTQGTTCCWSGSERAGYHTWEDGVISDVAKVRRWMVVMVVLVMDAWWWCLRMHSLRARYPPMPCAFVNNNMYSHPITTNLLCAHKSREFADGYVLMSPLCTSADPRSARRYAHVRVLRVLWMLFPIQQPMVLSI